MRLRPHAVLAHVRSRGNERTRNGGATAEVGSRLLRVALPHRREYPTNIDSPSHDALRITLRHVGLVCKRGNVIRSVRDDSKLAVCGKPFTRRTLALTWR